MRNRVGRPHRPQRLWLLIAAWALPACRDHHASTSLAEEPSTQPGDDGGMPPAVDSDGSVAEDAASDTDTGVSDASKPDATAAEETDADTEGDGPDATVASMECADCGGETPLCLQGQCVQCTPEQASQCEGGEVCNPETHLCVEQFAPFELDCDNLPSDSVCTGGPREVLLATQERGFIAMFDPDDGSFLGWFRHSAARGEHFFATQGPDQCIWTTVDDRHTYEEGDPRANRAVERYHPDGTFLDSIIRKDSKLIQSEDGRYHGVVNAPRNVAFTRDKVYVASYAGESITRFDLSGNFEAIGPEVLGSLEFLMLGHDGSLIVSNESSGRVELLPADGSAVVPLIADIRPKQVAYAGAGQLLVTDYLVERRMSRVDLASQMVQSVLPYPARSFYFTGVAPLNNGKWLTAAPQGVMVMDPDSDPEGLYVDVTPDDPASDGQRSKFHYVGRACLDEAFVASRGPDGDPPVASCDAPPGDSIFEAHFESGDLDGFVERAHPEVTVSLDPISAGAGETSLKIAGGHQQRSETSGVFVALDGPTRATYVEYSVRIERGDLGVGGYFSLNRAGDNSDALDVIRVNDGQLESFESSVRHPVADQTWVRVQLRDFDWTNRTYDLYVDCARVANDIPFPYWHDRELERLELYNFASTAVSWFDDIIVK